MSNTAKKPTLTPYLFINGAAQAIEFYKKVFGAKEIEKHFMGDDGRVCHAELQFGDSLMMLADEFPEYHAKAPKTIGGTPVSLALSVPNVDEVFALAIKEGATELQAVKDQFYGERAGMFVDPWGHMWHVSTHVEDLSAEEIQKRMKEWEKTAK
jgi:PhnB protein